MQLALTTPWRAQKRMKFAAVAGAPFGKPLFEGPLGVICVFDANEVLRLVTLAVFGHYPLEVEFYRPAVWLDRPSPELRG